MAAKPSETLNLSQGAGSLVRLSAPMTDVFVSNDAIADVQVRSATQLYVFGKSRGETTIYATAKNGKVVCFFQSASKFDARYATFGFSDEAHIDEGAMWPTSYALKELTAAAEAEIAALVKQAAS